MQGTTWSGTGPVTGQVQVGDQPVVVLGLLPAPAGGRQTFECPVGSCASRIPELSPGWSVSMDRSHGAPHVAQHPFSEVPSLMVLSGISSGKVAKWASGYGCVAICHTDLRFAQSSTGLASYLPLNPE